jgi:hypothetical protein
VNFGPPNQELIAWEPEKTLTCKSEYQESGGDYSYSSINDVNSR